VKTGMKIRHELIYILQRLICFLRQLQTCRRCETFILFQTNWTFT